MSHEGSDVGQAVTISRGGAVAPSAGARFNGDRLMRVFGKNSLLARQTGQ
jgi:hypothetical protein